MIDRSKAKQIGREVEQALQEVAERHGLTVDYRGGTYDPNTYKPRITLKSANADESEFKMYASRYGLERSDFGREFVSKGRLFRITGVSPRSPKRPILCEEVDTGRRFKFTAAGVKAGLAP
jgi:hypothetical protein